MSVTIAVVVFCCLFNNANAIDVVVAQSAVTNSVDVVCRMSSADSADEVFSDDDFRKYAEPHVTSGGQRVWLQRYADEPRTVDDPLRFWVYVNTQSKSCGHLDEPHPTNPICVEYWRTQNIIIRNFSTKKMADNYLSSWREHAKVVEVVGVSAFFDLTDDSQATQIE